MNNNSKIDPVRNREGSQRPSISNGIEAILFWKAEPISKKKLGEILKVDERAVGEALLSLKEHIQERGIVLLENDGKVTLGTHPNHSKLIEDLQKEELNKDLSKASLETLSIVLYKNGASRSEIDYIRGVNSSFTLRALSIRGLIEKITDPKDSRRYLYKPSFELLSFMGIQNVAGLPDFESVKREIEGAAANLAKEEQNETTSQDGDENSN